MVLAEGIPAASEGIFFFFFFAGERGARKKLKDLSFAQALHKRVQAAGWWGAIVGSPKTWQVMGGGKEATAEELLCLGFQHLGLSTGPRL